MSPREPRAPRPAASSRPIPTLECFAAALAASAVGAGCRNPFDRTVPPPEPVVRPDTPPAMGLASVFATGALMTTAPEHAQGARAPRNAVHAAVVAATPGGSSAGAAPVIATPGGCAVKESARYWGGGGAMISVRPYHSHRYYRYTY